MAWGLPDGTMDYEELQIDISSFHSCSFSSVEDAVDKDLESRYFRLCLTILTEQLNETIEIMYKWRNLDWMHRAYEGIKKGEWDLHTVATAKKYEYFDMKSLYNEYIQDWTKFDSVINIWFTEHLKVYLDSLNLNPVDCIEVCKDIVNEDRRLGIDERDIAELFLPQYEDIRTKKSPHGQNKNTEREPTVRLSSSTEAVSASGSRESGYPASFLRRSERWREESRRSVDNVDDVDGECGDDGLNYTENV